MREAEAALPLGTFELAALVVAAELLELEAEPVAAAAELAADTVGSDANRSSDLKVTQFDNEGIRAV